MSEGRWDNEIAQRRAFNRHVASYEAAQRWGLERTLDMLFKKLEALGYWIDDAGAWRDDTRPIKPIDERPPGTWADHHADF